MTRIKHWHIKEGFLIGGGLLALGVLLQATIGPIDWNLFAAPVNYVMLSLLLALIGTMYLLRRRVYAFEWMMHFGAAITWLCYQVYLHFRKARPDQWRTACLILLFAFVCLQICWWGINYLPSAQDLSVHTYNMK